MHVPLPAPPIPPLNPAKRETLRTYPGSALPASHLCMLRCDRLSPRASLQLSVLLLCRHARPHLESLRRAFHTVTAAANNARHAQQKICAQRGGDATASFRVSSRLAALRTHQGLASDGRKSNDLRRHPRTIGPGLDTLRGLTEKKEISFPKSRQERSEFWGARPQALQCAPVRPSIPTFKARCAPDTTWAPLLTPLRPADLVLFTTPLLLPPLLISHHRARRKMAMRQ